VLEQQAVRPPLNVEEPFACETLTYVVLGYRNREVSSCASAAGRQLPATPSAADAPAPPRLVHSTVNNARAIVIPTLPGHDPAHRVNRRRRGDYHVRAPLSMA